MITRRRFAATLAGAGIFPGLAARAEVTQPLVLVELFTSQGCNSCPPADRLIGEIAARDDVLPLSLHVDYWDYLGWRDTFAKPDHGRRQHAYRDAWSNRVVYTPQIVVQGVHDVQGTRIEALDAAIRSVKERPMPDRMKIVQDGGVLKGMPETARQDAVVWVAEYSRAETVEILRGENSGKTITYHNVVTNLSRIGEVGRVAEMGVTLPQPSAGEGVAVWLQDGAGGPVLCAARYEP